MRREVHCPHCGRNPFDEKVRQRRDEARWKQFVSGLTPEERDRIDRARSLGMFSDDIVDPSDPTLEALGVTPLPRFGEANDPLAEIPIPGVTPITKVPFTCANCGKRFTLPVPPRTVY
jgi:hypothetical protein